MYLLLNVQKSSWSIIFGSDYQYESLSDMMKFMNSLELTEEEKEKVFHLNAEKYILGR